MPLLSKNSLPFEDKKTLIENYSEMGLASSVNNVRNLQRTQLAATWLQKNELDLEPDEIFREISKCVQDESEQIKKPQVLKEISELVPVKKIKFLSENERKWMERLTEKYGTDYKKMAKDLKMNAMQLTTKELERKFRLF